MILQDCLVHVASLLIQSLATAHVLFHLYMYFHHSFSHIHTPLSRPLPPTTTPLTSTATPLSFTQPHLIAPVFPLVVSSPMPCSASLLLFSKTHSAEADLNWLTSCMGNIRVLVKIPVPYPLLHRLPLPPPPHPSSSSPLLLCYLWNQQWVDHFGHTCSAWLGCKEQEEWSDEVM